MMYGLPAFLVDVADFAVFLHACQSVAETAQVFAALDGFGDGLQVVIAFYFGRGSLFSC